MKLTVASSRIIFNCLAQRLILALAAVSLPALICRGEARFVRLSYPGVETVLDGAVNINDKYILAGAPDYYANRFDRIGAAVLFDAATYEPLHLLNRGIGQINDEFGDAVALGKNLAYVAAPFSHGSVTAFDLATGQRRWTAGTNVINTYFGEALAASDDFVVASAPKFNDSHGRLHILSSSTGSEIRTVVSPASDVREFGHALAMHGNLVLAGAPGLSLSEGDAYLYDVASDQFLAHFHPDDLTPSAQFGNAVDLSNKYALIGAFDTIDFSPYNGSGAAYVYDATTFELLHKLEPSDGIDWDWFGMSVAISGELGLVASRSHRAADSAGSLYVFDLVSGEQLAKFESPNARMNAFFGWRMATHGTSAVIASFQAEQPVVLLDVRELVPEPSAAVLFLPAGVVGILGRRRRSGAALHETQGVPPGSNRLVSCSL